MEKKLTINISGSLWQIEIFAAVLEMTEIVNKEFKIPPMVALSMVLSLVKSVK